MLTNCLTGHWAPSPVESHLGPRPRHPKLMTSLIKIKTRSPTIEIWDQLDLPEGS
jgi:hypothetical protein